VVFGAGRLTAPEATRLRLLERPAGIVVVVVLSNRPDILEKQDLAGQDMRGRGSGLLDLVKSNDVSQP
jgi:hypothetical protein